jgi:hypothetical protein
MWPNPKNPTFFPCDSTASNYRKKWIFSHKNNGIYPSEFKTWEFGKAAAPGLKQRSGIEAEQLVSCPMQMTSKIGMAGKPKKPSFEFTWVYLCISCRDPKI